MYKNTFRSAVVASLIGGSAFAEDLPLPPLESRCIEGNVHIRFNQCTIRPVPAFSVITEQGTFTTFVPQLVCSSSPIFNEELFAQFKEAIEGNDRNVDDLLEAAQAKFDQPEGTCPNLAMF